jgi:N-acetylmuramoyl-L-alanine amidase
MRKIFLSAGHSNKAGKDRGASGNGFIEGELTVELRKLIADELIASGVKPIIDDNDSVLSQTVSFFKNITTDSCIVVDLHWNAGPPTATGTEVLIPSANTKFERELASNIAYVISKRLGIKTRGNHAGLAGVKTEAESHHGRLGWMRLTGENILPEICFISNKSDMESYQKNKVALAKDIAMVLLDFAREEKDVPPTNSNDRTHTVVSGDSLSRIAQRYGTTVPIIRALNDLKSDVIKVGQVLKVK